MQQFIVPMIEMYESGASVREVASHYNTSAATVMRMLKKHGKLRNKTDAQKRALASGKSQHPTKGKKRTTATRLKIGKKQAQAWSELSEKERQRRKDEAKDRWNDMPDEKKLELNKKALKAIKEAASKGSKMEHYIKQVLKENGYNVVFHKKELIPNTKLEVDILVPELKTVIEIDGPSHYRPIWGEQALQRTIKADAQKDGLLLAYGYLIVRIRYDTASFTLLNKTNVAEKLIKLLSQIKNKELGPDDKTLVITC